MYRKILKSFWKFWDPCKESLYTTCQKTCRSMFRLICKTPAKYTKILGVTFVTRKY